MVQFEHDKIMKRYNVKVPFTLAGESSDVTVAAISEDKEARITVHRELSVRLMRQILLHWDEYEHQMIRKGEENGI
jgi:carbamoylphosphate synthase large subunit